MKLLKEYLAMRRLKAYIAQEQGNINDCLMREISVLRPLVQPLADHVLMAGGKRLRPLLVLLTARALGNRSAELYPLACSVELLHSATLVHDDIIDDASLRRGRPAVHVEYGNTKAVLAGDALLALANVIVARYGDARQTATIADAIMQTASGEIAEIEYLYSTTHPLARYIEIIEGKTAYMMQASCALGAQAATKDEKLVQAAADFGMNLGIAFQIVDDALDFAESEKSIGKPVAGDLREGKLTPPLHLYMQSLQADDRADFVQKFESGYYGKAEAESNVKRIAAAVREKNFTGQTRDMADSYLDKASDALECLPDCEERLVLLEMISYVKCRSN